MSFLSLAARLAHPLLPRSLPTITCTPAVDGFKGVEQMAMNSR
jgi:hypothetical protein